LGSDGTDANYIPEPLPANSTVCKDPKDQNNFNDLVRDLGLSKENSELLACRLWERNPLQPRTNVTYFRKRESELLCFFTEHYFDDKRFVIAMMWKVSLSIWV